MRRPCTRCDNGWFQHPGGWAVACPNCRPETDVDTFWLPPQETGDGEGRIVRRWQLPSGHPSQAVVPMPEYVRPALAEMRARLRARHHVLDPDTRRSA